MMRVEGKVVTRKLRTLSGGASVLTLMLAAGGGGTVLAPASALAACTTSYPDSNNALVTCNTSTPNPDKINSIPEVTGSTFTTRFDIADGAVIENSGAPAVAVDFSGFTTSSGVSKVLVGTEATASGAFTIRTTGDNAPAILHAPPPSTGDSPNYMFEYYGGGNIATTGNGSSGMHFASSGGGLVQEISVFDPKISTQGNDAAGIHVERLGIGSETKFFLADAAITTAADNSAGIYLEGVEGHRSTTTAYFYDTSVSTSGDGSGALIARMSNSDPMDPGADDYGFNIERFYLTKIQLQTKGRDAPGIVVGDPNASWRLSSTGDDYYTYIENTTIATEGDNSPGHTRYGFPQSTSDAIMGMDYISIKVATQGTDSHGMFLNLHPSGLDGSTYRGFIDFTTITTNGDRSPGLIVGNDIAPTNRITPYLNDSTGTTVIGNTDVTTFGADSPAFAMGWRDGREGTADQSRLNTTTSNIKLATGGDRSTGFAWYGLTGNITNTEIKFTHDNFNVSTAGDDANGVVFDIFADSVTESTVRVVGTKTNVATTGDRSSGIVIGDNPDAHTTLKNATIKISQDEATVTTTGAESHGIVLGPRLGTETPGSGSSNELRLTNLSASTSGANAHALVIGKDTTLSLADQNHVGASTSAGTIVNGTIDSWDKLTATGTGGYGVMNNGIIYGTYRLGADAAGSLANSGLIEAAGGADDIAVQFGGANDRFMLGTEGTVIGSVEADAGSDSFILGGAGTQSFDAALIGTQYNGFELFEKTGASKWTLTGSNPALSGPFSVLDGTLVNNADLQSMQMTVARQGRLAGTGTVGDLTIDGAVAPGNSIGTINVAGNVTFNTGSTYEVELEAPDKSDRIAATGTATINGGEVVVTKLSAEADYKGGQSYRIIEADGGVVKNAGFTYDNPFLFLSSELEYGTNSVDIALLAGAEPDKEFQSVARTHNQFQSAMALSDLGTTGDELTVFNQLALMTDADEARRAFDLASGEIHASGQHVIDRSFSQFSRTLRHQAGAGIGSVGATIGTQVYTAPLAYGPLTTVSAGIEAIDAATVSADRHIANAWFAPLGGGGTIDADGNARKLDWWSAGFAGGYEGSLDVSAGNAWAGFGLGYMRGQGAVNARRSTIDADNFQLGIYGGWTDGPWTLTGSFAYAASNIDTERKIAFGGIDRTARADYWAHSVGLSGEAAYAFALGTGTVLSPLATLDAGWSGHGGFTETGAGALNLSGSSESWTRLDTGLGLAVAHTVPVENGNLTLEARALWEHAFADVTPGQSLAFAGSPTGFDVLGPDAGRDRLRIGAGLAYRMTSDMTLTARYDGLFSSDERSHTAAVGFNFKF